MFIKAVMLVYTTHYLMTCEGGIPKLLIISLDGFRSDYLDDPGMTNISELMKWTFVPHMRPVFPSKTFPNHVSMATGLFSDQHGVIGLFFNASGALIDIDSSEYWNYNPHVTPIWAANEEEGGGRFSGCMMWPGCSYIKTPTYNQPFNMSLSWEERVGTVISWFRKTEQPANLVLWYLEQPDLLAHAFGPDSPEVTDALRRVDDLVGYVIKSLRLFGLLESVNLVVTSDHGMVAVPSNHLINLDTVLDPGEYMALGPNPVLRIVTLPARTLSVYDQLRDGSENLHYSVYVREKIPARWHYGSNRRVSDILLVADEGYLFLDRDFNETLLKYQRLGYNTSGVFGNHGYDPALVSMHHPLVARGPAFRRALVHSSPLENVDLYPLAAAVLQLEVQRHNGSLDRVLPLLVQALHPLVPADEDGALHFWSGGRSPSTAGFWATVAVLGVVGFTLVCATYQCLKRRRLGRLVNESSMVKGYDFRYTPVHNRVHQTCSVDEALKPVALHAVDDDSDEIEYLLPDAVTANQQA